MTLSMAAPRLISTLEPTKNIFLEANKAQKEFLDADDTKKAEAQLAAINRKIQEKKQRATQLEEPGILAIFPWHKIEQVMDSFTAGWARGISAYYKGVQERLGDEEKARSGELTGMLEASKGAVRNAVEEQRGCSDERR